MQKSTAILELVEGYAAYTDAQDIRIDAASAAPAASPSSPQCIITISYAIRSSKVCAAASAGAVGATLTNAC